MGSELKGKVAVVTGASSGLGRTIAEALAGEGARVALVARRRELLEAVASGIRNAGGEVECAPADVTDAAAVATVKSRIESQLGPVSILVNAAGVFGPISLIKDVDAQQWVDALKVNLIAPFLTCNAFVGGMVGAGWGRIVNVSSAAALHPPGPLNSVYGTSKVGLNQFTRHLAAELQGTGVTANVFHPGDVKTEMWGDIRDQAAAMGANGEAYTKWAQWVDETGGDPPEKAAQLVLRLVGAQSAAVNGQFLWIEDGLQAPIPSWGEAGQKLPWS